MTVANTWAANDTATVTIGTKDLTVTVGSGTLAAIAAELIASINAATNTDPAIATGWTRNVGGQSINEFREVTASAHPTDTTKLLVTANTPGVPIVLTVSESTAGTGTLTASNSTVATGPNFLNNADNYLGGALPVDDDTLYFDTGSVSALHALTYFRSNNIDLNVIITNDWTGQLGLPATNANGYAEYRSRYFQYRGGSKSLSIEPGLQGNLNAGPLWIDLQDQTAVTVTVAASRGANISTPSIFLAGSHASTLSNTFKIISGSVSIEPDDAPTSTSKYFACDNIQFGQKGSALSNPVVVIGRNARLYKAATGIVQFGGQTTSYASTNNASDNAALDIHGGTFRLFCSSSCYNIIVRSGAILSIGPQCGTVTQVTLYGGTLDGRETQYAGSGIITKSIAYAGSSILDPAGGCVGILHLAGCSPGDLAAFQFPSHRKWDLQNAASP